MFDDAYIFTGYTASLVALVGGSIVGFKKSDRTFIICVTVVPLGIIITSFGPSLIYDFVKQIEERNTLVNNEKLMIDGISCDLLPEIYHKIFYNQIRVHQETQTYAKEKLEECMVEKT